MKYPWEVYVFSPATTGIVPLRHCVYDKPFGFGCLDCGAFWKIYQNEYHYDRCTRYQVQSTAAPTTKLSV